MTTTPEARILPELRNVRFNGSQSESLKQRGKDWLWENLDLIISKLQASTPAIADTTDLFICRRSVGGGEYEGATCYYIYTPLQPYTGAIADSVGVEWLPIESAPMYKWCLISDGKDIILARQDSYGDWDGGSYGAYAEVMETITLKNPTHWMPMPAMPNSTPPQAATGEG